MSVKDRRVTPHEESCQAFNEGREARARLLSTPRRCLFVEVACKESTLEMSIERASERRSRECSKKEAYNNDILALAALSFPQPPRNSPFIVVLGNRNGIGSRTNHLNFHLLRFLVFLELFEAIGSDSTPKLSWRVPQPNSSLGRARDQHK
ncbi:hypothetical protein H5410_027442 [Solanum commersonii]|uniref:Uncharacterized protein n=1 Tax=Solanum commersonii TaxID=4109 RepID=A0A9J5Z4G6_SOLCO|nr:hypothetical protein H5410_027442 [Solanum commersonii]